jgi:hypothetical protein
MEIIYIYVIAVCTFVILTDLERNCIFRISR